MIGITIEMPETAHTDQQAVTLLQQAHTLPAIANGEQRKQASELLCRIGNMRKQVLALFADSKKAASDAHKAICTAEKKLLAPIEEAHNYASEEIARYDRAEFCRAEQERVLLQAIAEEAARKERERLLKQAAKTKSEERKEALQSIAESIVPVVPVSATDVQKAKGEVVTTTYKAELTDISEVITAAASGNQMALSCLCFDQVAANKLARAMQKNLAIPGVRVCEQRSISYRNT